MRQAFAKAVDKDTLINKVLEGAVVQADTIIPPGMPGYNAAAAKIQDLNVADAQKLLADAGFPDGKDFPKVALSINNQDPNYAKIAAACSRCGRKTWACTVDINTEELAKFNDDLTATANKPDDPAALTFYISVWGADYPDPQNFVSQQLRTGVGNNNGHYSNAEFDKLVDQADVETDQAKRLQALPAGRTDRPDRSGLAAAVLRQGQPADPPNGQGPGGHPAGLVPQGGLDQGDRRQVTYLRGMGRPMAARPRCCSTSCAHISGGLSRSSSCCSR